MTDRFPKSLVFRTGLTLAAIVLLALVSIIASVVVADRMEGDAEAINVAGSLRMQSYKIGLLLNAQAPELAAAIDNFEIRLASPVLASTVADTGDEDLEHAFMALGERWHRDMKPLLQPGALQREKYLARVTDFVNDADRFVRQLQYASEDKIRTLRIVQGLTVFLTLALVFAAMYGLNADVISPLYELVAAARATGRGEFTVRVEHTTEDELGVLGQAFNTMADDIQRGYSELEARVQEKTAELQRNNAALETLYRMSRLLAEPGHVQARIPAALRMIADTLHVRPAFFIDGGGGHFRVITPESEHAADGIPPGATFPVASHAHSYGELIVDADTQLEPWAENALRSVAEILATALSLEEGEQDQRRILLMEERAVIARELHDSLAQTLSYQKIQVSRLDALMSRNAPGEEMTPILDDLREGLNSAYRQLRELLTTFRLRIDGSGLDAALAATVAEFHDRGLEVRLDDRLAHCPIAANEEIHALQVVREALSNVARHAQATGALVSLYQRGDGHVEIVIEDDGIGMPSVAMKRQHHGLVIMRERAATLGGNIRWEPVTPRGTRVVMDFRPAYFSS